MRSLVVNGARRLVVAEKERPDPGRGEVRVDVHYCGICGSDLHTMFDTTDAPTDRVLGHEFSGVVGEVGPDAGPWRGGDRVAVLPIEPCGTCPVCTGFSGEVCATGLSRGPGLGRPGGLAESVLVASQSLYAVPDGLSDPSAAMIEPLAVAIHGVQRSGAAPGSPVVVLGGGPIGMLTVAALQARTFERIALIEPKTTRRIAAERLGIPAAASGEEFGVLDTLGEPPLTVIDCTGHPSGAWTAVELLPPGGTLVMLGLPFGATPMNLLGFGTKELHMIGALAYTPRDYLEAIEHLAANRIPVDKIITKISSFAEANTCISELRHDVSEHIKILLDPRL